MDVNIILKEPVIIDGKTVKPDGKPISVTEKVSFELFEAGAAVIHYGSEPLADEPSPEAKMQEVIDAAVSAATTLLQGQVNDAETKAAFAFGKADELMEEVTALKAQRAERDAEITGLKAQNTSAAKTTPKKGAAAETA